jgi:hypothetical protein
MFRQSTFSKRSSRSNDARSKRPDRKPEKKRKRREVKLLGGLAAGIVGGLVATWALDRYQEGSLEATRRAENTEGAAPILSRRQEDQLQEQQRVHAEAAERIARSTFGTHLSRRQRRHAAPIVHYAVGALTGGIYGLTAEVLPIVRRGYGTGYSNLLFLGGSQAILPWFNLASGPQQLRASRAGGLSAPLVYGAVLETTRRILRWFL